MAGPVFASIAPAGLAALAIAAALGASSGAGPTSGGGTLAVDTAVARADPLIVGVGTHFGIGGEYGYEPKPTADAIGALGVTSFRDDLPWGAWKEKGLGAPGRMPPRVQAMIDATKARPLLILGHAHPASDGGAAPREAAGLKAFGDFAADVAGTMRARPPILEVWNEWNLNAVPDRPRFTDAGAPGDLRAAVNYTKLAVATTPRIRAADPKALVLVGAAGIDPDWKWVEGIVAGGAMRGADGLSIHYYNHCQRPDLRTAAEAIGQFERLHDALSAKTGGKSLPLYVTEIGWPTSTGGPCDISREAAGENVAQFLLWSAATPWIKGVWIYQLKDQGRRPQELEDNLGLYDYDYKPKPAVCMVRDVTTLIAKASAWRVTRPVPGVTMVQAKTSDGPRVIAWTDRQGTTATLSFGGKRATARPLCSTAKAGAATIALGTRPVVIDATPISGAPFRVAMD